MATIIADGVAEDLIRSFQQQICTEGHYKTLIEKYQSELTNGLIDVEDDEARGKHTEKLDSAIEELTLISELRRTTMKYLMEMYPNHDKNMWCVVKHLAQAAYCALEACQAADNDAALLNIYLELHARFLNAVTRWLGTEITSCAACFTDIIKGVSNGESEYLR